METTAPYTPEQNGRSERDNRTIVESARSMLHAKQLPTRLWAEAMNTAVYILNRTPTLCTKGGTPYEIWMRKKPSLAHLRIFGSEVFVHVPKEQRSKWDKKSKKMIFVGYQQDSSNYRLYDPQTAKIIVSRDVKFNDSEDKAITLTNDDISLPLDGNSQQLAHGDSLPVEQLESDGEYESTEEESP